MIVVDRGISTPVRVIALANLVESQESGGYRYIATRIYDSEADTVADVVLESQGQVKGMSEAELGYASWRDLPTLDIRTKQLVGKNKDKYCTLISTRVFKLVGVSRKEQDATACCMYFPVAATASTPWRRSVAVWVHVLGYTFMDVNGDKRYMTVSQLRESDILQHTHSTSSFMAGELHKRVVMVRERTVRAYITDTVEMDDVDTTLEDEEVEQTKLLKALIGGWYTMGADGTIQVDANVVNEQRLEELEVPEGILHISHDAFYELETVKRIKLPETVRTIGEGAFSRLKHLAELNIPKQVKELQYAFMSCESLKCLDLSGVERLGGFNYIVVERLILPDVMQKNDYSKEVSTDVLEFRNVTNAAQRVLKANTGRVLENARWKVGRIETNGPVVLGNYRVRIDCTDASALEPNIVGIAPNCSFFKRGVEGNPQPWELGPNVEFVYAIDNGGYRFTEEAYAANKLRAAVVGEYLEAVLPKSVEILQGVLSEPMRKLEYPNVAYVTYGLCRRIAGGLDAEAQLPALRWVLPRGEKVYTAAQIRRLERNLTSNLSTVCKRTQEVLEVDLTDNAELIKLRHKLLCTVPMRTVITTLFKEFGMIYVGDYSGVTKEG